MGYPELPLKSGTAAQKTVVMISIIISTYNFGVNLEVVTTLHK